MTIRRASAPLAALILVLSACTGASTDGPTVSDGGVIEEIDPADRETLEPFSGQTLEDGPLDTADYPDQVLVLNVWGSWCTPCRDEAPALARASEEFTEVQFIGINVRDNDAAAIAFERGYGITYPSINTATSGPAVLSVGDVVPRSAVPATVIVGRNGEVTARVVGPSTYSTLAALISAALEEPAP